MYIVHCFIYKSVFLGVSIEAVLKVAYIMRPFCLTLVILRYDIITMLFILRDLIQNLVLI